jgi:hypothetical protein
LEEILEGNGKHEILTTRCYRIDRGKKPAPEEALMERSCVSIDGVNLEQDRVVVHERGQTGVPIIEIGGNWIVYFHRPAIDLALADSGSSSDSGREATEQRKVDQ